MTIARLNSAENLVITGGRLTLLQPSTINGDVTFTTGTLAGSGDLIERHAAADVDDVERRACRDPQALPLAQREPGDAVVLPQNPSGAVHDRPCL